MPTQFHLWLYLVPTLAITLATAVRYTADVSMTASLITGGLLAAGLAAVSIRSSKYPAFNPAPLKLLLWPVLFAAVNTLMLYNPTFSGLPGGGGDSGNHLAIVTQFSQSDPKVYVGFTSFHTLVYWLRRLLTLDAFEAFRAGYYIIVILMSLLVAHVLNQTGNTSSDRRYQVFAGFAASTLVLLPVFAYDQQDGFFAHLFSLPLVLLLAVVYSTLSLNPYAQWTLIGALIVATRFSYGLHLSETIATFSVLFWRDRRVLLGQQVLRILICLAGIAAAVFSFKSIFDVMTVDGAYRSIKWHYLWSFEVTVCIFLWWTLSKRKIEQESVRRCLECFAGLLTFSAFYQVTYAFNPDSKDYYFYKSFLTPAIVAILALLVLLPVAAKTYLHLTKPRRAFALAIVLALITGIWKGYRNHRNVWLDRMRATGPWEVAVSLADVPGLNHARSILNSEGRAFGGILVPDWGAASFAHAFFSGSYLDLNRYQAASLELATTTCAFWYEDQFMLGRYDNSNTAASQVISLLAREPRKYCHTYDSIYNGPRRLTLCHLCPTD